MWILTNLHDRLRIGELADGGLSHGLAGPGDLGDGEHGQHVAGLLPGVHPAAALLCPVPGGYKPITNPAYIQESNHASDHCVDIFVVCVVKYFLQHSDTSFMITAAGDSSYLLTEVSQSHTETAATLSVSSLHSVIFVYTTLGHLTPDSSAGGLWS